MTESGTHNDQQTTGLSQSEINDRLASLEEYDGYLRAESGKLDHPRWIRPTRYGYRWLDPAEGRREEYSEERSRTLLRHYDELTFVDSTAVVSRVRKLDQGLDAFTDGGRVDAEREISVDDLFSGLGSSSHQGHLTPPEVEDVLAEVHPVVAGEFIRRWASARDQVGSSAEHPDFRDEIKRVLDEYQHGYSEPNDQ